MENDFQKIARANYQVKWGLRFFFGTLIVGLLLILFSPAQAHAAITNYVRTPSGTPISGASVDIDFDYAGSDATSFSKTAVFLFNDAGTKVGCQEFTVVGGVGGSISANFAGLANGDIYDVKWGKIDSSAPSYAFCTNVGTLTAFNSTKDGYNDLENGTPAFVIDNTSGGGTSSTTATSTPTEVEKATLLAFFLMIGMAVFGGTIVLVRQFV